MLTIAPHHTGSKDFTARVILTDGSIAGEGYGPSEATAMFYAVYDAVRSDVERFRIAGFGHAVYLNPADHALIDETYLHRELVESWG